MQIGKLTRAAHWLNPVAPSAHRKITPALLDRLKAAPVEHQHHVYRTGEGTDVGAIGLGIYTRLTGADTKGTHSLFEYVVPPNLGGPPTHLHSPEDELFTCVQGRVAVELDGEEHVMGQGESLLMPRGPRTCSATPSTRRPA
ncbi:cupin domain-containing protein [Allokutzneria sp. NRRL B-24872]|uniref:cupin domain-containing protein n=1 Tax=Allokutzneria sp. NRRL B-24872 TaxID=1137961 RepID=UPI001FEF598C|nr:cupin domain-containing protein [Allokutzneria sp. NRRL B-24872]